MRKIILILAGLLLAPSPAGAGVLKKQCPCPAKGSSLTWSAKCCKADKAPPQPPQAPPDDSNTCESTPASCTGQWCTACDEMGCVDIDGPGISASLCDGELSWCTPWECGSVVARLSDDFALVDDIDPTAGEQCEVTDGVPGDGRCFVKCPGSTLSCDYADGYYCALTLRVGGHRVVIDVPLEAPVC